MTVVVVGVYVTEASVDGCTVVPDIWPRDLQVAGIEKKTCKTGNFTSILPDQRLIVDHYPDHHQLVSKVCNFNSLGDSLLNESS